MLPVEGCKLKAPERPEVEKEQDERHRDEHRLAHQAEGEEKEGENIEERSALGARCVPNVPFRICFGFLAPSTRHVSAVRHERKEEKECTQHIFAFGSPGNGFDVERMQRKKR